MIDDHCGSVTVSIVSHLQGDLVASLLEDLADFPEIGKVVLVYNRPEPPVFLPQKLSDRIDIIENAFPKGFGANHNAVFARCDTPFFCIINPDVRLSSNPFSQLLEQFSDKRTGLCAPAVVTPEGHQEDSARRFPTPWGLFLKVIGLADGRYRYSSEASPCSPDWVAGMFMLVRSSCFGHLGGFDEGFFLYYEDVDFCARLRKAGWKLSLIPGVAVIHAAGRMSHRNLIYLKWHMSSMLRYFRKHLL